MGGFIGAEVALQFPRASRSSCSSAPPACRSSISATSPCCASLERLDNVLILGGGWAATRSETLTGRPRMRRQIMKLVAHRAEQLPAPLIAEQVRGSGKPGFVPALDALSDYPIRDRLGEIACPVLVVWGEKDRLVPVSDAYEFGRLIPHARVVVWPDTGHVAMLERPARSTRWSTTSSRSRAARVGYHAGSRELQDKFGTRALADRLEAVKVHPAFRRQRPCVHRVDGHVLPGHGGRAGPPAVLLQGRRSGLRPRRRRAHAGHPQLRRQRHVPLLGNVNVNPHVGLLFIDFRAQRRMRVNGTASIDPASARPPTPRRSSSSA